MATPATAAKKARRKPAKAGASTASGGQRAGTGQPAKSLTESAQQIWLAGLGAFGRAQAEGTRLFEALVKEGMAFEKSARSFAGHRADAVRDVVGSRADRARGQATVAWERLEKGFEDRLQQSLARLGVPSRDDLLDLSRRVDALTAELRRRGRTTATGRKATAKRVRKAPGGEDAG